MKAVLLIVSTVLAIVIAFQWGVFGLGAPVQPGDGRPSDTSSSLQANSGVELVQFEELPDVDFYQSILDRPLFNKDRRPFIEAAPTVAKVSIKNPLKLKLNALVLTPEGRVALVEDVTGVALRLQEGEEYQGWRIKQVLQDRVVFTRDAEKQEMLLRVYPKVVGVEKAPKKKASRKKITKANRSIMTKMQRKPEN